MYNFAIIILEYLPGDIKYPINTALNNKVSLWKGNIMKLEVDAIVCSVGGSLHYAMCKVMDMQSDCNILSALGTVTLTPGTHK